MESLKSLTDKVERIKKILEWYRKIAIYMVFAGMAYRCRYIYISWIYLTIAVILSIPFFPIEALIIVPLSKYEQHLRKKAREEHLRKVREERENERT